MTTTEKQIKLGVLIDMLENYNNVKKDWYIKRIIKELKEIL